MGIGIDGAGPGGAPRSLPATAPRVAPAPPARQQGQATAAHAQGSHKGAHKGCPAGAHSCLLAGPAKAWAVLGQQGQAPAQGPVQGLPAALAGCAPAQHCLPVPLLCSCQLAVLCLLCAGAREEGICLPAAHQAPVKQGAQGASMGSSGALQQLQAQGVLPNGAASCSSCGGSGGSLAAAAAAALLPPPCHHVQGPAADAFHALHGLKEARGVWALLQRPPALCAQRVLRSQGLEALHVCLHHSLAPGSVCSSCQEGSAHALILLCALQGLPAGQRHCIRGCAHCPQLCIHWRQALQEGLRHVQSALVNLHAQASSGARDAQAGSSASLHARPPSLLLTAEHVRQGGQVLHHSPIQVQVQHTLHALLTGCH